MKNLIVCNKRRVSDFLGFKVNDGEDILKNINCKKFIKKYQKYFKTATVEDFIEFNKETGLKLSNMYFQKNSANSISFNTLGSSLDRPFKHEIYNHDLVVINEVDNITIQDNKVIIDGIEMYTLNTNKDAIIKENLYYEIRYELSLASTLQEKNKIIQDKYNQNYELKEDMKQIYLSSFGNLFVLYEDGTLYKNNKKYAEDVLGIWEANSYVCYLIFKDYHIEYLQTSSIYSHNESYDKVIFNDNYLALLRHKELEVISKLDEVDTNYHAFFSNVDNISFGRSDTYIFLEIDNRKIIYSIYSFMEKYE